MSTIDLRFYKQRPYIKRIDVGSGIHIVIFETGDIGFEHVCSGIFPEPGDEEREFLICPLWPGEIVAENPLTLRPSLLCLGSALTCGLHGHVENGVWKPS